MLITNKFVPTDPLIYLNNESIPRKHCVRYLGLNIDEKLKFYDHIDHLKSKLARFSGVARRLCHFMNLGAARKYYYSCIYSALVYCVSVWGGAVLLSYRGQKLIDLHRKLVLTLFAKFSSMHCPFKTIKILKIPDIHRFYCAIHMYKLVVLKENKHLRATRHDNNTCAVEQLM